jgi:glyoxylase-like metal-dependent hydrolase (beta-lactamase superfamily II)
MTSGPTANVPAGLTIDVYTTPGRPIVSATKPGAPDDLIYGDHDAILVDTLAAYDQADGLADWIETKGRRLSRVYITHGHPSGWTAGRRPRSRCRGRP